jgi:hypothetical protein
MRRYHLIAATIVCGSFATAAAADCAAEIDALAMDAGKGGALAPMSATTGATPQTGGEAGSADETKANAGKDGSLTPMAADPSVATSAQDAQAQSEGGETAAEQAHQQGEGGEAESGAGAEGEAASGASAGTQAQSATAATPRDAALDEARAALAKGDEDACMAAVEKAKAM